MSLAYTVGYDRGAVALGYAAQCYAHLGHPDRALALSEEAVALAQRVQHPFSLAIALFFEGLVHFERAELDGVRRPAAEF